MSEQGQVEQAMLRESPHKTAPMAQMERKKFELDETVASLHPKLSQKPSYPPQDQLRRQTYDFKEIPGGKIRRRHDRHQRGYLHRMEGEMAYFKGIPQKRQSERNAEQYLIEEGLIDHEEQRIKALEMYYEIFGQEDEVEAEDIPAYCAKQQDEKPFDPKQELQALWNFRKHTNGPLTDEQYAERREQLLRYKRRLVEQEIKTGVLFDVLYQIVQHDPSIDAKRLKQIAFLKAEEARFTPRQRNCLLTGVDAYAKKHDAVAYYAEQYKDPADFYKACFGKRPQGKVEVDIGPINVSFRCFNVDDYVHIWYDDTEDMNQEERKRAIQSGGVAISSGKRIPALAGTIIAENAVNNQIEQTDQTGNIVPMVRNLEWSLCVRQHEEQHGFNKLFIPEENNDYLPYRIFAITTKRIDHVLQRNGQVTPKDHAHIRKQLLHDFALWKRKTMGIDTRARDEILARYRDGRQPEEIIDVLQNNSLYDYKSDPYYAEQIQDIPQEMRWELADYDMDTYIGSIDDEEVQQQIKNVFGKEYKQDIGTWVQAVKALEVKGYGRNHIIGLLYGKPALHWVAQAKRLPFANTLLANYDAVREAEAIARAYDRVPAHI